MTYKEFNTLMQQIGYALNCPAALDHFKNDVAPPFFVWTYEDRDDVYADDSNYQRMQPVRISYCSDFINIEAEELIETQIETIIDTPYRKYGATYIDSETMYQTDYEMEIVLNGRE